MQIHGAYECVCSVQSQHCITNHMVWVIEIMFPVDRMQIVSTSPSPFLQITCGQRARLHKHYYLAHLTLDESIGRHLKMFKPMFWHNFLRSQTAKEPATYLLSYVKSLFFCYCIFSTLSIPIMLTLFQTEWENCRGGRRIAEKSRSYL